MSLVCAYCFEVQTLQGETHAEGKSLLSAPFIAEAEASFVQTLALRQPPRANANQVGFPPALGQLLGIGVLIYWLLFTCEVKWQPPVSVYLE